MKLAAKLLGLTFGLSLAGAVAATTAQAEKVKVAIGNLPPHADITGKGREADIIRAALTKCGHTVVFEVQPFTKHWASYEKNDAIHAVATVPDGLPLPGHRSNDYIKYHNGVSSLSKGNFDHKALMDLKGLRVIAFASAKDILPGLADASPGFKSYAEKANQITQSMMLFSEKADAVLGDGLIFAEYNASLRKKHAAKPLAFDPTQDVNFKAIFKPTPYAMMFKSTALRDDFNRCYGELKTSGDIAKINQSYVDKYADVVGKEYQGL